MDYPINQATLCGGMRGIMDLQINPSTLSGRVQAPASKSQAHRLLICAALSDTQTRIRCNTSSKDIEVTIECLRALGTDIQIQEDLLLITPISNLSTASLQFTLDRDILLDCNESGSTLRFLLPVVAALGVFASFTGVERLAKRPLSPLYEELLSHDVRLSNQGTFPLQESGQLQAGTFTLEGGISSQFFSGLLFALPLLKGDSKIKILGALESESYIHMTIEALNQFGVIVTRQGDEFLIPGYQTYHSPELVSVEGDWSNAAFWLSAGAIGSTAITCSGLQSQSLQGDMEILSILKRFGAAVTGTSDEVTVFSKALHGIEIDASNIPDLVPVLSVVAACASGTTRIYNAGRLRFKESDRLAVVTELLHTLGADITELEDSLIINGGKQLSGGVVSSHNDHRIAMSAAIASLICSSPIVIHGAEAVHKSYPGFYDDFASLGGSIIQI